MRTLRPDSAAFMLLLGALVTLASFATGMGLPMLAETAESLGVAAGRAALTLSIFMAGFALGPLVVGALSDHYGRRPLLAACGAPRGRASSGHDRKCVTWLDVLYPIRRIRGCIGIAELTFSSI